VTGVVALLLAKNPGLSAGAAYRILRDTSGRSDVDVGDSEHVNACAAVVSLMGRGSCRTSNNDLQLADKQEQRAAPH
jgi:hypothetical protein